MHSGHLRRTAVVSMMLLAAVLVGLASAAGAATSWSIVASPNPTGSTGSYLNSVACTTATNCFAVGYSTTPSISGKTLIERWNGTRWSIVTSPNPAGATGSYLNGVSCKSGAGCVAVGYSTTASSPGTTLIERWDGTRWLILASPNPSGATGSYLNSVSCTSATSCLAVGYSYDATATSTLATRLSGTTWSIVASPNRSSDENDLLGVSCTSATSCIAVGYFTSSNGSGRTLAERWNGTSWTATASASPAGSDSYLNGVACASATSCFAVGDSFASGPGRTLVERWNGSKWTIVASASRSGADSYLNAVRCVSASSCVAVGFSSSSSDKTLAERWNGSKWTIVASANPTGPKSYLNAVACPSATSCVAAGDYRGSGPNKTLIERG